MNDLLDQLTAFFNQYNFDRLSHNFIADYSDHLQTLDNAESRGYAVREEQELLQELIDGLDSNVKFDSEQNENFNTYLF